MGLFGFIGSIKKNNNEDSQMSKLIAKVSGINQSISALEAKIDGLAKIYGDCATALHKLDMRQKEMSLQLDDLNEAIAGGSGTQTFVDALIAMADQIEHFYLFAQEDTISPLYNQSAMMWRLTKKSLADAGIKVIERCGVPLDTTIHLTEGTAFDHTLPNGYVIKVLSSGYSYNGEVIRRATVIINKVD